MSKLKQIVSVVALAVLSLAFTVPASATDDCTISNTGPGSTNTCENKNSFKCTVDNNNHFEIKNSNDQTVASGTATTSGNTSGGNATTGSATNSNGTTISVSIENGACAVVAATPAQQPGRGGAGGAGGQGVVAPVQETPPVLANTSADSTPQLIAGGLALAAAFFAALRLGLFAYARR